MAVTPAPYALPLGQPQKLNGAALTAPADVVFTLQPKSGGDDFSVLFQIVGTVTTHTSSLQTSLDGGTTWVDLVASANFFNAITAATAKIITPLVAGALYRIHATVLTGSQDFWACSN